MDSSRGTSTQTIVNNIEQCKAETMEKDSETDSNKESIHSNWSELLPINRARPLQVQKSKIMNLK